MLMFAAYLLILLGFAQLALSQERHRERVSDQFLGADGARSRTQYIQRWAGFTLAGLALPLCIASEGAGLGTLLWVVLLTASAMTVAFTLTWRPRWLRPLLAGASRPSHPGGGAGR